MKELSLNILDIAENSVKAGASLTEISITEQGDTLTLEIKDVSFERTFHIIYHKNKYISTSIQNFLSYLKSQI